VAALIAITVQASLSTTPKAHAVEDIFQAVESNQFEVVQKLLQAGAPVSARDGNGVTPLMQAAVYAGPEVMRLLLSRGADPNAANEAGSTALMWSIGDMSKVRILVDTGADVNARFPGTGVTPLTLAARHTGSAPIVKLLIAKGADINAVEKSGLNAVAIAASAGNTEVLRLLLDKGVSTDVRQTERIFEIPNLGSEILEAVAKGATRRVQASTALMAAVASDDPEVVKLLLNKTPDVNAATATGVTALFLASPKGNSEIVRLLLEAGADPNVRDERGFTPLILASGSETRNAEVVWLLLAKGAKLDSADQNGETALTWARKLGDTPVVRLLREAGATGPDPEVAMLPKVTPEDPDIRRAIARSLALLQYNGPLFFKRAGCVSCHNVSIPLVAMTTARERGFAVDNEVISRLMKAHLATLGPHRENLMQTNCTIPGLATTATFGLMAMKAAGYPRDGLTDAIIHCLAQEQQPDGHWRNGDTRPPLGTGEFAATALSVRTIQAYAPQGRSAELAMHVDRGRRWLAATSPKTNNDSVFQVLGLAWSNAPPEEVRRAARRLLRQQRSDGSWAQLPEMSGDAFATAQSLVALRGGAGVPVTDSDWQRGIDFLLHTQLSDGSWHVKSRAFGFQPYFESGFPHGHDQWISAAATSWATIALVYASGPKQAAAR
jgi:ankyrin repeat protein